ADRRPRTARYLVASAVVASAILYVALAGSREDDSCTPPTLGPAGVWSVTRGASLATAGQADGAATIAADFRRWAAVPGRACRDDSAVRASKLACLDGVLAPLDASARALGEVHDPQVDVGEVLVDPALCDGPRPPRLVSPVSDERRAALVAMLDST